MDKKRRRREMEAKKIWKKEEIKTLLQTNDKAVLRGIVVIYSLQTEDEQMVGETIEHNGVGFNGVDASFMSSLAKFILDRGYLTAKQLEYGRRKIMKYAGQLAKVANGELKVTI